MKRLLQLCFFVVATILLFGRFEPAQAQRSYLNEDAYNVDNPYQPHFRSRRKVKRLRRSVRSRQSQIARSVKIGRLRRKDRRYRNYKRIQKPRRRAAKKRKFTKRKVASLNKKIVSRKKTARRKKKQTMKDFGKGPIQIIVSLPNQRVSIYKGGKVIASSRVSTGKLGHRTPSGVFSIIQKHKKHFSNLYDDAPMPFMQRITWSGVALHAGNVSRPYASHGCIRMPYGFAKKLFKRTRMGAHVIVASSPSSPKMIIHDNLFQPVPKGALVASNGVQTVAYTDRSSAGYADLKLSLGGLSDFVKPVIVAKSRLEENKILLEKAIAAGPVFKLIFAGAKQHLKERRDALVSARKDAKETKKALRKPWRVVRKIKRQRAPKLRALKKAEGRAKWAHLIVEKRRDNPKFEGNWMNNALARAAARDLIVVTARVSVDEITVRLDEATRHYDGFRDQDRKVREMVVLRRNEVKEARALVKKAGRDIVAGKKAVRKAKSAVLAAHRGLKSAIAREKLPLRILVTPRLGRELIKDVQKLLAELGHNPGPIDGAAGSKTKIAVKAFQRKLAQKETGLITDELVTDLYAHVGRVQSSNAHMYVRQGFVDLFDVPVDILEPAKPLGTHVYTAMHFEEKASLTNWTALTVKEATGKRVKKRRDRKKSRKKIVAAVRISAKEALDRIKIPGPVRRQLSLLMTPGSSMVISDKGMSRETGKGTDFVVLTK
jgi:lipoprotein-anchoring transpeptidase ErfK/SrfK/peptidoglycan hydrolase-like protein with peptidoglycan-binding domain